LALTGFHSLQSFLSSLFLSKLYLMTPWSLSSSIKRPDRTSASCRDDLVSFLYNLAKPLRRESPSLHLSSFLVTFRGHSWHFPQGHFDQLTLFLPVVTYHKYLDIRSSHFLHILLLCVSYIFSVGFLHIYSNTIFLCIKIFYISIKVSIKFETVKKMLIHSIM